MPPSAIATFSNLVLSLPEKLQHKLPHKPCPTGPQSLPTEILQIIFQFVFASCVNPSDSLGNKSFVSWLDEDPLSPFLFPFALACVCLRWFRILKGIPIYWTRQVITVDTITTSLRAVRLALGWTGDHPLKIIVTRHHGTSEPQASERTSVCHTIQLLRPHIRHIWSLSFDVEHSSSIPALWRESGRARQLKVLTLMSRSDAHHVPCLSKSSHEYKGKLKTPVLQQVTMSSYFLRNTLMAHPRLTSWFKHTTSLTVRGGASSGGNDISLYKFLFLVDTFPSVQDLTIEDIHFDDNTPYPGIVIVRSANLCLRRVTGRTALRDILIPPHARTRPRDGITVIDCSMHGFLDSDSGIRFCSNHLTVASTDRTAAIEDLVCRWNGGRLCLVGCPRVSRAFLARLHGEVAPLSLSQLHIVDCDNFSAADAITLVKSRKTQAASISLMGVLDDDVFMALTELRVQGRGPPISIQQATWLAKNVDAFIWDTVGRDGLRYKWDATERLRVSPARGELSITYSNV